MFLKCSQCASAPDRRRGAFTFFAHPDPRWDEGAMKVTTLVGVFAVAATMVMMLAAAPPI
jgi:hypothetical protein